MKTLLYMKVIVFLFLFIMLVSSISAIRITEVELNPTGTDAGYEWVELYNKEEANLNDYKLVNNDGDELILNRTFSGYYIYIFSKQWLDNSDEKIFLYKNTELVDETDIFSDSKNNDMTWQLCESWEFKDLTKGENNGCSQELEETDEEPETEANSSNVTETPSVPVIKIEDSPKETELKTIDLNPKVIKSEENSQVSGKRYAIYGLFAFGVLLGLLFLIKNFIRKKYKNEFK